VTHDVPALIAVLDAWADARAAGRPWDYDENIQAEQAARALGTFGEAARAAVPTLVRAMHADQRGMGELAAPALGRIGGDVAIRELNRIWFSGWDRKLCDACHGALTSLGARAHDALLRGVDDPEPVERLRALHGLRAAGYPAAALATLALRQLIDAPVTLRDQTIEFFGGFTDATAAATALPALRAMADDDHQFESTRAIAARVVAELTDQLARR
jgi:hypothetical protein